VNLPVRHDFMAWLPKLPATAVVLFLDSNVRENNFAVFAHWRELANEQCHFEVLHRHGLGVPGIGPRLPASVAEGPRELLATTPVVQAVSRCQFAVG
jgi:hypothetical protein